MEEYQKRKEEEKAAGKGVVVGIITFLCIWGFSFAQWGFLIGLAIGWFPALIGAVIMGYIGYCGSFSKRN